MKINTPNGILEGESIEAILKKYGRDCLRGANLRGADLRYADLRYADLRGADLRYVNLSHANLRGADLRYADLRYADLRYANLRYVNLSHANLRGADLWSANLWSANLHLAILSYVNLCHASLNGADLSGADLRGVRLWSADLSYADLSHANHVKLSLAKISILPDEGDIIGWKKAWTDNEMPATPVIVKLLIPADAQRSNATGRKCRASKARILDLQDQQGNSLPPDTTAYSGYDTDFTYKKGETIHVEDFDTNRWNECAPGIHFFITRIEAVEHY
ncbi:pentapeptide repeat-containing protein [Bifidobacterium catenulatum]|uniref:pentapeptide repeat-containing protein n=1 Tax=Bifidobacterium catenulatum TaxID=1686 RepID=UPI003D35723B